MTTQPIRVGCAGWSIASRDAAAFPREGTNLERYAARFCAVEINSSFYRSHRIATFQRWAAAAPTGFAFAVKLPRAITHARRLAEIDVALDAFLAEVAGLAEKRGPLLAQLPPSLAFDAEIAGGFFAALRRRWTGGVVCEPRHAGWLTPEADRLLAAHRVSRVAADPPRVTGGGEPGGWPDLIYYRLHGTPRIYYSSYSAATLDTLAARLADAACGGAAVWCIFDNTAAGAATRNALALLERLRVRPRPIIQPG
jgi:uncharacterized protein YecE (DUF72 family)